MTPKLVFWLATFVDMSAVVALATYGWWAARHGRIVAHRRAMHLAAALLGLFVVAYVAKVVFLGKEDLAAWSNGLRATLYVHESFIAAMLASGIAARALARRALAGRFADPPPAALRWHRWLGRGALLAAIAALLTGGLLIAGMWQVEMAVAHLAPASVR